MYVNVIELGEQLFRELDAPQVLEDVWVHGFIKGYEEAWLRFAGLV